MGRLVLVVFIVLMIIVDIYMFKLIFLKENNHSKSVSKKEVVEVQDKKINLNTEETQTVKKETSAPEKTKSVKPEAKKETKITEKGKSAEGYMIAKMFVNLRAQPDVNSDVVTVIKKGAKVKIIGKKAKHWKRVLYPSDGRVYEGWVDDRFFTPEESLKSE
ncbi:SH3 domain-containing protein [Persephonella atlantica]|uniref:SH3 domain-containing protein n=1 Tax=Persephonella atlantica TaxID=2699429 RepID=A0ABS1GIK4_9AQUI|nr:SH3 domain-containing protein [Persephonella atlantica]MBK3332577.1 SH3 domain-containing protein [Persephonella atlantica]